MSRIEENHLQYHELDPFSAYPLSGPPSTHGIYPSIPEILVPGQQLSISGFETTQEEEGVERNSDCDSPTHLNLSIGDKNQAPIPQIYSQEALSQLAYMLRRELAPSSTREDAMSTIVSKLDGLLPEKEGGDSKGRPKIAGRIIHGRRG